MKSDGTCWEGYSGERGGYRTRRAWQTLPRGQATYAEQPASNLCPPPTSGCVAWVRPRLLWAWFPVCKVMVLRLPPRPEA